MQTDTFTTQPVRKLFFHYLLPSICGTMVTSIYVLADTIIIGKGIGIDAMAALNIVLPLFNIFFGTGLLFGVGGSVLMSIARGRGDADAGHRYFSTAVLLNAATSILYMFLFIFFLEDIARFLGATNVTMPYIMDYAPYILWGLAFFSFSTFLQTFVRNDGAPRLSMAGVVTGGILNVILDIVFVFPLNMGMAGAAIASVIGSITTCLILLCHFFSKKNGLKFTLKGLSPSFGVSMYGVITNSSIVVTCLCNGINQASQPIISTNHGAGLHDRIQTVKRLGLRTALIICAVPAILGLIVPNMFTYIFLNPNAEILALSETAIRIYFSGFFVMGINIFVIGYFQSTVKPQFSLILCLSRGCILSVLFVYVLPLFFYVAGIWASVPLAEFITLAVALFFLKKTEKEVTA